MYATIDTIQTGSLPFKAYSFSYTGPKPSTPPRWMEQTYELNARNIFCLGRALTRPEQLRSNVLSPSFAGSDKTTVSVATGHQEYHPIYISLGNLTNTARRAHGNSVLPVAFLPIPKTSKSQRKHAEFQHFCHQLYHNCLEVIFEPLRRYMTTPTVVKCPDGQFRHAIFGLGPYIADYPEQVWLAGIVSNWCAKCDVTPDNLDSGTGHQRTHEKTNYLIKCFDSRALWDAFGVYEDVMPFTHSFPCTDIHELLTPDLLHQLIKGIFKDHLVTWVGEYLHQIHGESCSLEIIADINQRISIVLSFPGRDFNQWMGDDSKALIKVYLGAIAGYLPPMMVCCISTFIDACYVAHRNTISTSALEWSGVRMSISLPRQHALSHYALLIQLFGSPNGLCSSITESKHIKAILRTLVQLEKMAAHHHLLASKGLMKGTTASYMAGVTYKQGPQENLMPLGSGDTFLKSDKDGTPVEGTNEEETLSVVVFGYPHSLEDLANNDAPNSLSELPQFHSRVRVHHSAVATFFAPSDLCGTGGMLQERIRSMPSWYDHPCHDTVYVVLDDTLPSMEGMVITHYKRVNYACAFVNWLVCDDDKPNSDTGMWTVSLEEHHRKPVSQVIDVRTIARTAHLLPIFGSDPVPPDIQFKSFFVNAFVDHHAHAFLTDRH
ncbi:hypothetical protein BJY52DRAFT_1206719 [Lactarius psammicola]|nr:hypothetical protein BJY52DRAFT_1206719 [Lactarius psammicola]